MLGSKNKDPCPSRADTPGVAGWQRQTTKNRDNKYKLSGVLGDGLPRWLSVVKNLPASAGDPGSIPGLGRSPGEGNGYPLQYSYLENSMDGIAWRATVHGVAKSWT